MNIKNVFNIGMLVIVALAGGTACTSLPVSTPFKVMNTQTGTNTFTLVLTEASVRNSNESRGKFDDYVDQIVHQISEHEGLYGYSLRKELLGNKVWTMTVWRDPKNIQEFKVNGAHLMAMAEVTSIISSASFARIKIKPERLPISWEEALNILEEQGRSYSY